MVSSDPAYARNRLYADANKYVLPSDNIEQDRLDVQHHAIVAQMYHSPIHAKVDNPKKILDIGCGIGSMSAFFAETFPSAKVFGIDLARVPEDPHRQLPNVHFIQADISDITTAIAQTRKAPFDLPDFEPESFDYVFSRLLLFGVKDWQGYVQSVSDSLLRPGGWLECHDVDMSILSPKGDALQKMSWFEKFESDTAAAHLDIHVGSKLEHYFQSVSQPSAKLVQVKATAYPFELALSPRTQPGAEALTAQIPKLFKVLMEKVGAANGRSEEELQNMYSELEEWIAQGPAPGTHYRVFAVSGQKVRT